MQVERLQTPAAHPETKGEPGDSNRDRGRARFARRILGTTSLDDFVERVLKPQGLDAADFDHFLRHELGIQQLIMTAGLSGKLVTPQEA